MRIFFATDIHGSERCFLKFLNAARFYEADVLILGGDITGKMLVPVVQERGDRCRATLHGEERVARGEAERAELEKQIRFAGFYPYRTTPDELAELKRDAERVQAIFQRLMIASLERWLDLAEDRLKGTGVSCFIQPGNDDGNDVEAILRQSGVVTNPEGQVIELPGGFQLASAGWSNPTPWACPRELPEDELGRRLEAILSPLADAERAIFNLHCPPYETGIDSAPELDACLRAVVGFGGQARMMPVGSTSVRRVIEDRQPLLGLHGHIHESRGTARLGRTLCINPGSRYNEGILQGAVIDLESGRIQGYELTSG